ncbi:MAG TPA: hypothetical protein VGD17_20105 [Chitinophagaceae bacterium]
MAGTILKKILLLSRCSLAILFAFTRAYSQEDPTGITQRLIEYNQLVPHEKLFAHTDKDFYIAGETIWFKLYYSDAGSHRPLNISKVAYVELLDHEAKPLLQVKIGLAKENGEGNGSLQLPAFIASGNYLLRAYTSWMKNFDKVYFFQKEVTIVNTSKRPDWMQLEKPEAYRVNFFPEGGNMVYGLTGRLAFHITDQYGKGMDGDGIIVNENNDTVSRFTTGRFGIGSFDFKPDRGSTYKAFIRLSNGTTFPSVLPQIHERGFIMRVSDIDNNKLKITVQSAERSTASTIYLVSHTRRDVKLAAVSRLNNGTAEWEVSKDQLGEGVSHLTIFNEDRRPVCERLVFKKPASQLNIKVKLENAEYNTRSLVNLNLQLQNEKSQPVNADVSVAVFRIDSLQHSDVTSIDQYFWLTSDLSGTVESPAFYFNEPSAEVNAAIDNLMLTHGWRRFRWEELEANRKPVFEFLPELEGLTVNARVTEKSTGKPASGILSYLSFADQRFQVSNSISDPRGQSVFVARNIYGPQGLVLQTDSNHNRYRIDITDPYFSKPDSITLQRFLLREEWKDQLNFHHLNARISNSFKSTSAQQFLPPILSDTFSFFGKPDKTFYLDDYTRFPTMEEVMREFVDAVRVRKDKNGFHYEVLNLPAKLYFSGDPLVLLDGVPLFDVDRIIAFDPLKVKKIDVLTRKYFWGDLTNSGIVSYSTYDGDLAGFELDPAALVIEFQGLQLQREFYQPDYSTAEKKNSRVPDVRNVLYWNGRLTSKNDGFAAGSFYTSDLPGIYAIIVQGMTQNGVPGCKIFKIVVKQ